MAGSHITVFIRRGHLLRRKQGFFSMFHLSLIICVGAPNKEMLPAFDECKPHGSSKAEPTPDMQSRGRRFVHWVRKTEHCWLQRAGFAWLCFCEFSFLFWSCERNRDPWATQGPGFYVNEQLSPTFYRCSVPGPPCALHRTTLIRIQRLQVIQCAERPTRLHFKVGFQRKASSLSIHSPPLCQSVCKFFAKSLCNDQQPAFWLVHTSLRHFSRSGSAEALSIESNQRVVFYSWKTCEMHYIDCL